MTPSVRTLPAGRQFLSAAAALYVTGVLAAPGADADANVQVWKDPSCGCCKDWTAHLERQGFEVRVFDQGNTAARARLWMQQKLGSCHTAVVQGYVIEGHVPAGDIQQLLKERPKALGLAVTGMPISSPGMDAPADGGRRDPYQVLLVRKGGTATVFSNHS